jgi:hypothetical protein
MDAYFSLIQVAVLHDYFADGICRHLQFVPTPETLTVMQRYRLMMRTTAEGIVILAAQPDAELAALPSEDVSLLRFAVLSNDPAYMTYTDGYDAQTRAPLYFSDLNLVEAATLQASDLPAELMPAYWRSMFGGMQLKKPCLVIDLHFSDRDLQPNMSHDAPILLRANMNFRVLLHARKMMWKYFFWGECAKKAIEIVDLNKAATGIGFESSLMPVAKGGVAWVSSSAIPMQEVPTQRFQLREVEVGGEVRSAGSSEVNKASAGRVLIKRLPNAGITKFGKEQLRDGVDVLVAEIYINQ